MSLFNKKISSLLVFIILFVSIPLSSQAAGATPEITNIVTYVAANASNVTVRVKLNFKATEVIAAIGNKKVNLTDRYYYWEGTLDIQDLPHMLTKLSVTASNHERLFYASKDTVFLIDTAPYIGIRSPFPYKFLSKSVLANVYTIDDLTPASMKIYLRSYYFGEPDILASSPDGTIKREVSLGGAIKNQELVFESTDGKKVTKTYFPVYIDPSHRLVREHSVPGRVLDFDETRILFVNKNKVYVKYIKTGVTKPITVDAVIKDGKLTPKGCLLEDQNGVVYDHVNGNNDPLSNIPFSSIVTKGNFALFYQPVWSNRLYTLRNLLTQQNQTFKLSTNVIDFGTVGDVVYKNGNYNVPDNVYKVQDGMTTVFGSPERKIMPFDMIYDGKSIAYYTHDFKEDMNYLYLYSGSGEPELVFSQIDHFKMEAHRTFEYNNGWLAYFVGGWEIAIRNPQGEVKIMYLSPDHNYSGAEIISLSEDGQVLFVVNGKLYTASFDQPVSSAVSYHLNKPKFFGSELYGALGDAVVKVLPGSSSVYRTVYRDRGGIQGTDQLIVKYSGDIKPGPGYEQIQLSSEYGDDESVQFSKEIRGNELFIQLKNKMQDASKYKLILPGDALTDPNNRILEAYDRTWEDITGIVKPFYTPLEVSVTNSQSFPIDQANVSLTELRSQTGLIYNFSTDAKGKFSTKILKPGIYLLTVSAPGYLPQTKQIKFDGSLLKIKYDLNPEEVPNAAPYWDSKAKLAVSNIGYEQAQIAWPTAIDEKPVTSYRIKYSGQASAVTVAGDVYSLMLKNLKEGTSYSVQVEALDERGQWSAPLYTEFVTPQRGVQLNLAENGIYEKSEGIKVQLSAVGAPARVASYEAVLQWNPEELSLKLETIRSMPGFGDVIVEQIESGKVKLRATGSGLGDKVQLAELSFSAKRAGQYILSLMESSGYSEPSDITYSSSSSMSTSVRVVDADFDRSGVVDIMDVALLSSALRGFSTTLEMFDMNVDGLITIEDMDYVVEHMNEQEAGQ
ncbi:hypothetical protein SY83_07635 [Paenibacillus swuensis]|uniref:Fibronectin type-III domain-containing protein n=1 Tax=Paenibacillus swuensis TaxID=1178515 RepID=A0A172TGJ6_9BACL|nr:carboxypeptidase regulatory-like domain-containing protein [Paenibacillus swuensis]ANE46161.1 hypothetical protein SY83_07635 [Paenibacillus swuensis]